MSKGVPIKIRVHGPGKGSESPAVWFGRQAKILPAKVFYPAQNDAINRTITRAKTRSSKAIRRATGLPARAVNKRLRQRRANDRFGNYGALTLLHRDAAAAHLVVNLNKNARPLGARALANRAATLQDRFPGSFLRPGKYSTAVLYDNEGDHLQPQTVDMDEAPAIVARNLRRGVSTQMRQRFIKNVRARLDRELRKAVRL